jgi:hypothetical protein
MVKPTRKVLTPSELEDLGKIEDSVADTGRAEIVRTVEHIECIILGDVVTANVYSSQRPVYKEIFREFEAEVERAREVERIARMPPKKREMELFFRRIGHSREYGRRMQEWIVLEAGIREEEINAHKWFLSQREGKDVGIYVASAHWLKEYSESFCALGKRHYASFGLDFELEGMERAVVINAPGKHGGQFYSVLVLNSDLFKEEMAAEKAAGLVKMACEGNPKFGETASRLRYELLKAEEAMHVCVLGRKGRVDNSHSG